MTQNDESLAALLPHDDDDAIELTEVPHRTAHPATSTTTTTTDNLAVGESWTSPRSNIHKVFAICFGFIVFGMNDASLGAIVERLETHYRVSYTVVSLTFLCAFVGYLLAALLSDALHRAAGRGGVSCAAVACQLACYLVAATAPPFAVFVGAYAVAGFGNGLLEASWNAWAGTMRHENELLGLLHASYGIGGIVSPTIETAMISRGYQWNRYYFVMIGAAAVSLVNVGLAFRMETPEEYRKYIAITQEEEEESFNESGEKLVLGKGHALQKVLSSKLVWLASLSLFAYVGCEVTMGGWVTVFFIEVRGGSADSMGYVATGFWAGMTAGRLVLGYVNGRLRGKEELAAAVYMAASAACVVLFWLVQNLRASAAFVGLAGFFMGPLYPVVVVVVLRKLPRAQHVLGVGVASAFGGVGAAVMPFVNGALSTATGPQVLGPLSVSLLAVMLATWLVIVRWF